MILLIVILMFVLIVASTWWFGLWSNVITLVNLVLSALIATSFYEDVTQWLISIQPTYRMVWEYVSIWLVFAGSFFVLRGMTDLLSRVRLKFDPITELVGRSLLSAMIAGVFITFTLFTFHLAPWPPEVMSSSNGVGPDRLWISFVRGCSRGALSVSRDSQTFGSYDLPDPDGKQKNPTRVFDPDATFIERNLERRKVLANLETIRIPAENQ